MTTSWPWATSSCTPIGRDGHAVLVVLDFLRDADHLHPGPTPSAPGGRRCRPGRACRRAVEHRDQHAARRRTRPSRTAASRSANGTQASPCRPPRARARSRRGRPPRARGRGRSGSRSAEMPGRAVRRASGVHSPASSPASSSSSRSAAPRGLLPRDVEQPGRQLDATACRPGGGTGAGSSTRSSSSTARTTTAPGCSSTTPVERLLVGVVRVPDPVGPQRERQLVAVEVRRCSRPASCSGTSCELGVAPCGGGYRSAS